MLSSVFSGEAIPACAVLSNGQIQHALLNHWLFAAPLHSVLFACAGSMTGPKASAAARKPARSPFGAIENLLHEDCHGFSGLVDTKHHLKPDCFKDFVPSSSLCIEEGRSVEVGARRCPVSQLAAPAWQAKNGSASTMCRTCTVAASPC